MNRDTKQPEPMPKCVVHPERNALVRHLQHGWLCTNCAAIEGHPLAIQVLALNKFDRVLDAAESIGVA